MMRTFREYAEARDVEDAATPDDKPLYNASMGQMGSPMKRFGAAWNRQVGRDPDRFRNQYLLNKNRLRAGFEGNTDPYLDLARNPAEVGRTVGTMRNTLQRLQRRAMDRVKSTPEPIE